MELILNTDNIDWEIEDFEDILENNLNIRCPKGKVMGFVPLSQRSSHYGSICNNGAIGYGKFTDDLINGILSAAPNSDKVTIHKDNNNDLVVQYHDHDGTHTTTWKTITKSVLNKFNFIHDYGTYEEMIEFLEKRPNIKLR